MNVEMWKSPVGGCKDFLKISLFILIVDHVFRFLSCRSFVFILAFLFQIYLYCNFYRILTQQTQKNCKLYVQYFVRNVNFVLFYSKNKWYSVFF